jgi:hypothetical protein
MYRTHNQPSHQTVTLVLENQSKCKEDILRPIGIKLLATFSRTGGDSKTTDTHTHTHPHPHTRTHTHISIKWLHKTHTHTDTRTDAYTDTNSR